MEYLATAARLFFENSKQVSKIYHFERLSWLEINLPLESDQVTGLQLKNIQDSTATTFQQRKDRKSV